MNELRFLEVIGKIDDDLIRGAMIETDCRLEKNRIITKKNICALGSVAATAVIAVAGSVALHHAHSPSNLIADNSVIRQEHSGDNFEPDNNTPAADRNKITTATQVTEQNAETAISKNTESRTSEKNTNITNVQQDTQADDHLNSEVQTICPPQVTAKDPDNNEPSEEFNADHYYFHNFNATSDPYDDAYGADELPIVSIIVSGRNYYQINNSDHPAHNVSSVITDSDFGEYIGNITELFEYDDPAKYAVSSKEPSLSGADAYYYAPADSNAVIIVKKEKQCSIFVFNDMSASSENVSSFSDTFRVYGAGSAEDIESIFVSITVPNGSVMETASQSTITDRNKIKDITDVLYQLKPEARTDALSGSPEWLNNAWDAYRANPDAFTREDITLDITFKNGAVLKGISYQPYLGNGYVSGMQELTNEQNCLLKELLK